MDQKKRASFELQLNTLRTRLIHEVDSAEESIREDVVKAGDISSLPTHPADADVEGFDVQVAIAQNEERMLEQVETAIERIRLGTYGVCQSCGKSIDTPRLQAVPYAANCIDCARNERVSIEKPVRGEPRKRW
jgi:RNA polymerase-binding protein DksA